MPSQQTIELLLKRFGGTTVQLLDRVLTPYRLRISAIDITRTGRKITAMFTAHVPDDVWTTLEEGTTGKVVSREHVEGAAPWRELIKGRILKAGPRSVLGELYFSPNRLEEAVKSIKEGDYLEVDPFGVTSKIESALCEATFFQNAKELGFAVTRMPENVAKHIGTQNYYDFRLERDGNIYRVELKSLWGTDTTKARLIHTVSKAGGAGKNSVRTDRQLWSTSSCRFKDQDIFAVSLWLRTGRVTDFAFALSASESENSEWGLPAVPKYPDHVTQNPTISDPPVCPWTTDLLKVCQLVDTSRSSRGTVGAQVLGDVEVAETADSTSDMA